MNHTYLDHCSDNTYSLQICRNIYRRIETEHIGPSKDFARQFLDYTYKIHFREGEILKSLFSCKFSITY